MANRRYLRDALGRFRAKRAVKTVARVARERTRLQKRLAGSLQRTRGIFASTDEIRKRIRRRFLVRWALASFLTFVALWFGVSEEQVVRASAWVLEWVLEVTG